MAPQERENFTADVKLMADLKPLIISEARAIFSPGNTTGGLSSHKYDVVVDRFEDYHNDLQYTARLIIYDDPGSSRWTQLMVTEHRCNCAAEAMSRLLEMMHDGARRQRCDMDNGETYTGSQTRVSRSYATSKGPL